MTDHVKGFLTVFRALQRKAVTLVASAHVNDLGEARAGAAFILTILEQSLATIVLIENQCASHAPTFLRSMYEALVAVKLLAKKPGYLDQIRFDNFSDDVAIIADVSACANLGLTTEDLLALATQSSASAREIQRLKAQGIRQRQARDKFIEAENFRGVCDLQDFLRIGS